MEQVVNLFGNKYKQFKRCCSRYAMEINHQLISRHEKNAALFDCKFNGFKNSDVVRTRLFHDTPDQVMRVNSA